LPAELRMRRLVVPLAQAFESASDRLRASILTRIYEIFSSR